MQCPRVHVVGAGLAGSEASYFLAQSGFQVVLHEMRPKVMTPAHKSSKLGELVCSNSFKSASPQSAPGMLKAEMTELNSLILETAKKVQVPGGEALAVDRERFSDLITQTLRSHPRIEFVEGEVELPTPGEITLLATGPLTSDKLTEWLEKATDSKDLYFYDAIAPIVDASTIDREASFLANRYGKGEEAAYLNCPLNESEYRAFVEALSLGEKVPPKNFEKEIFFQGCQPIEAIAATGADSLRFGPMKPVGLDDPKTGRRPFAVVQLRPENKACTAYNLVGFQTKLKYGEQGKIFRMIPALKNAEFLRMGSIHRNTYVCGPRVLRPDLSLKGYPNIFLAGQVTGVEGYLESSAIGLLAGLFILQKVNQRPFQAPPANTALGALLRHVIGSDPDHYSPSNIHFGLFDPAHFEGVSGLKKDESRGKMAEQALRAFQSWKKKIYLPKEDL
ncbi:MAG: methylenetetrahydrofolate--tRNA-(uracil(54)-C(5))-methyltransferase (FADH(2)-oxidizing) TrmFO [Bdellovibrio sp.]|nr:methylenetetrahydrofolate--tRNA-(uracil(54)-C(5))-methyltransferase (FADH(2)-oxidizing) TrmFO [Bdellovibrio sp.]